ncbi:MAG: hypothetical protein PHE51_10655 [Eubacteriales bacterium]|nr:hypothetical protein [Eubacteriales bacterium]
MEIIKKLLNYLKKRICNFGKKKVIAFLIIAFIASCAMTFYKTMEVTRIKSMVVTLNYEEAKSGLNPDGSRFSISDIKSDLVLENAIRILGDSSLSVNKIKDRIYVDSKMPIAAIEKTNAAIASGSVYSYTPTEFDIYYSQKKKIAKNNTANFLAALSQAYRDYFIERYTGKNTVLDFDETNSFEDYDYYEIHTYFEDKINSMITYVGKQQEQDPSFRSKNTGYTFKNITNMLINLRDKDLTKLEAYILQNQISKDKAKFVGKQKYLVEQEQLKYDTNMSASNITNEALKIYDPYVTGVTFVPSIDGNNQYYMSRTKTGIDNLATRSHNQGITATAIKKNIDSMIYLSDKFSNAKKNTGNAESVDGMIMELSTHLKTISSIAVLTDNEYVEDKTKNYITFKLPRNGLYIPIAKFVVYFVFSLLLTIFLYTGYCIAKRFYEKYRKKIQEKFNLNLEDIEL